MNKRQELFRLHRQLSKQALELMKKKNHDYAGKRGHTPLGNLGLCEAMEVCSIEQGILIRMSDKLMRLAKFCESGELKVAESVDDTIVDTINYAILLAFAAKERNAKAKRNR